LELVSYAYIILLGIIIIFLLILFIWRINKVGDIIASVQLFGGVTGLIGGIFMLTVGFYSIYLDLFIKRLTIDSLFWIQIMTGVIFLILFLTSNVFIGLKGISFVSLPFYIPKNELLSYTLKGNRLILKRNKKSECEILTTSTSIKASDVKKVVDGMNRLAIKKI
jgi:hypothetical protein